ncbi:MAG: FAD-binding protein [Bacteroidetes bacterium GWF2_49_14]|nr:MAG: FAD-binding protein [Bacteroidetes bacterium GWF2_49_14]HBB90244.1 FAD-binding protein [Bacteroidales bacterium]
MTREVDVVLNPEDASIPRQIQKKACLEAGISPNVISGYHILKRSVDARRRPIVVRLKVMLFWDEPVQPVVQQFKWEDVSRAPEVVVVGAGPAGLFAALRLVELGIKPLIIERGKPISDRKRDIAILNRNQGLDPDSNYCFGEGGAGTFSDGKLYTRSKKRGDVRRVLEILHLHGSDESILYDSHPHIGTDRLPGIVTNIRQTLTDHGAVFFFNRRVNGMVIREGRAVGVTTVQGETITGKAVILATGHSAIDIYQMLREAGLRMEVKGFAMGVRIEHPQLLIDQLQYHSREGRGKYLPAAEYTLVKNVAGRGVYSFCMCPGGIIVPSSTLENEAVVNGMSNSLRNSPFANSGLVVEIRPEDLGQYQEHGPFAGLAYQQDLERSAFRYGGSGQTAPAQRLTDFTANRNSSSLPDHSYHPGLVCSPMHQWLPDDIRLRLQEGLRFFGRRMKGFLTDGAIMAGVESRTSSPVRIIRDPETGNHPDLPGLFPAGEGAGYAGGIVSSAMDGELAASAAARFIFS